MPELLAVSEVLELAVPLCEHGVGDIILKPDSEKLIDGVRVKPLTIWPDDRGYFVEVLRGGQGLVEDFDWPRTQISAALSYPGTIKAFHYHLEQVDCWTPAAGMFQFVLVDLRRGSPTYGRRNTFYSGSLRPWQIVIPRGVGHGYKVLGSDAAILVYATDRLYDGKDEGRIPYNDGRINYDWETQHK